MIIVTGGAGFIGSCIAASLERAGRGPIVVVDHLDQSDKWKNLRKLGWHEYLDRDQLFDFLAQDPKVEAIVHMGACSATTELDSGYLMENNYRYTQRLAQYAVPRGVRMIYASSAATYGDGSQGYDDHTQGLEQLQPLNMYGYSKHAFDLKAERMGWLEHLAGLKFFNVYGPNEYHKQDMTSVVYKAFGQISEAGRLKLFKSHRQDYKHGGQQRDFIYIADVVAVVEFLLDNPWVNGLYNVGTGQERSFQELAQATFDAMNQPLAVDYINMPEPIRDHYQYHTRADITRLRKAGYTKPMTSLEEGIKNYIQQYLTPGYVHY